MRAPAVIELDPVANDAAGVLQGFKAMAMNALLFQCPDQAFNQAILLWCMGRDELLPQAVATHQSGIAAAGEDQAIVGSQQERRIDSPQSAEACDQGVFQCCLRRLRLATARQMPAQQFAAVTVSNKRQNSPTIAACPDTAHVRCPALVRSSGHRGPGFDSGPETNRALSHLPPLDLEDPLHGVLVHAEQVRHGAVAEGRVLFDHLLHWHNKIVPNLRRCLRRTVIDAPTWHGEPSAQLADRDVNAVSHESLVDRLDHLSSSPSRDCNFFLARSSSIASPYASCNSLSCFSYCSRMSSGLVRRAFSIPRLASSTQPSISEGGRSNARLASATFVLPCSISMTSALLRLAVQRLISSSITMLISGHSFKVNT